MNIFKISLPGFDAKQTKLDEEAVDSIYPSPKVNVLAKPIHAGIFRLTWQSTGLAFASGTTRLLSSFPHNYNYIPSVIGVYRYDNGSRVINGIMPLFIGAQGTVVLDADRNNINLKYFSYDISGSSAVLPFLLNVRFYVFAERGIN